MKTYRQEYQKWPGQTQGVADLTYDNKATGRPHAVFITALTNNPRRLYFSDVIENLGTNAVYLDPWGRPYVVTVDENEDGLVDMSVTYTGTVSFVATNIRQRVAVMSWGFHAANTNRRERICSWIQ
jgi:hypothetical protein